MMAVYGNLTVTDDAGGDRLHRRFAMSSGAAEALTDRHSLNYLGALPQMLAAVGAQLDKLGGVPQRRRSELGRTRRQCPRLAGGAQSAVVRIEAGTCPRIGPAG